MPTPLLLATSTAGRKVKFFFRLLKNFWETFFLGDDNSSRKVWEFFCPSANFILIILHFFKICGAILSNANLNKLSFFYALHTFTMYYHHSKLKWPVPGWKRRFGEGNNSQARFLRLLMKKVKHVWKTFGGLSMFFVFDTEVKKGFICWG